MRHPQFVAAVGEYAAQAAAQFDVTLKIHYNPDSRRIPKKEPFSRGFPDLIIAGPGGILFAELKCADDTVSPEQRAWGAVLLGAGATWVIWEPIALFTGQIETELAALCVRSKYLA